MPLNVPNSALQFAGELPGPVVFDRHMICVGAPAGVGTCDGGGFWLVAGVTGYGSSMSNSASMKLLPSNLLVIFVFNVAVTFGFRIRWPSGVGEPPLPWRNRSPPRLGMPSLPANTGLPARG